MKKLSFILVVSTLNLLGHANAQISPGGVGTANLTAWLRADDLPAGNVTAWSTTYPAGTITLTDASAPYAQLETSPTNGISNYNRTIHFANNSFAGLNNATLQGLSLATAPNLLNNNASGNTGTFFCSYYLPTGAASNGHMLLYNEGSDAIQLRNLGATGRIALGLSAANSTNASRDWAEDNKRNIISYRGNRSNSTSMKGWNKALLLGTPATASQSSGPQGMYIGYAASMATSAFNGYVHEYIFFNNDLSDADVLKVHSYLAVKYGVTLNNTGGGAQGDYTATNNTIIWDASVEPTFHRDVIGIGKDNAEGLNQKQSHSFDDTTRIYLNTLQNFNETNTGIINSNISYVMMGHNGAKLCGTSATMSEVPSGITSRVAREFKITKTNFDQAFNWDVKIDTCNGFMNNALAGNLRLLVDTDTDFSNATVLGSANGLSFAINNGIVSVSGISSAHIANNATRFITIGYVDVSYTLTASDPLCHNGDGFITVDFVNTTSPLNITYFDGSASYTIPQMNSGDTIYLTIAQNTTYTFAPQAQPFACCGVGNATSTSISLINPPSLMIQVSNDTTICENGTINLDASVNDPQAIYHWDFTTDQNSHQTDNPIAAKSYSVYAENSNGCFSDTGTIQVSLYNPLSATPGTDKTICPGFNTNLDISGIAGGVGPYSIAWSTGDTGSGTSMTINVAPATTNTYNVTIEDACESSSISFDYTVTVAPLPVPTIFSLQPEACEPGTFQIYLTTDPANYILNHWEVSNGAVYDNQTSIDLMALPVGTYDIQVTLTSPDGCIDSASFANFLTVHPNPVANFSWSPDPVMMLNTEVDFTNLSQGASNYEWFFEQGSTDYSTEENPTITFPDGIVDEYEITLTAISSFGCVNSTTQILSVLSEVILYAPNTFTPDDDEFNPTWYVHIGGIDTYDFNLQVYNRWGELIWESQDPEGRWDGTYKGQKVETGTYSWVLRAGDFINDDVHTFNGHVNLLR